MSNSYHESKDKQGTWVTVTPKVTSDSASITTNVLHYQIIGKRMDFVYQYKHTAAGTSAVFNVYLPSGINPATSAVTPVVGVMRCTGDGGADTGVVAISGQRRLSFFTTVAQGTTGTVGDITDAAVTFAAQGTIILE